MAVLTFFRRTKYLWILAVILLGLYFLSGGVQVRPEANFLERLSYRISTPLIRGLTWVRQKSSQWVSEYILVRDSRQENQNLRDEVAQLKIRLLQMAEERRALESQWDHYRKLGIPTDSGLVAKVISQEPKSHFRTLTVDRGTQDGVAVDQVVVAGGGLVGRVIQADSSRAKVLLITDLRSSVDVLSAKTRARGTLMGLHQKLRLNRDHWLTQAEYISAKDVIKPGDLLLTSGLDGIFPHGIPAGVVRSVAKDRAGLFWKAQVEPYVEMNQLETVLILTQYSSTPSDPPRVGVMDPVESKDPGKGGHGNLR